MAAASVILDPSAENVQLVGTHGTTDRIFLTGAERPMPDLDKQRAGTADTEGDPAVQTRYRNRTLTYRVRVVGSSEATWRAAISDLDAVVDKVNREQGEIKETTPGGIIFYWDVVSAEIDGPKDNDHLFWRSNRTIVVEAKPFWRGTETALSDHTETTLPHIVFTEGTIDGDVPALGRLVIDDDQGADQRFLMWAIQSRHYDSANSAKLFYEAEGRTLQGGATSVASGSASASTAVQQADLNPNYQSMLSTQESGGGAHLSHIGTFRVWARVLVASGNLGTTTMALEWGVGDRRRFTRNAEATPVAGGSYGLVDLGLVTIPEIQQGAQQWEGRFLAKSTSVGDDLLLDCFWLFPVDEGYGEARAINTLPAPTVYLARDEFDQSAGNLNGKTAPAGGTWATAGATTDLAVEATGHTLQRSTSSDSGNGRLAVVGSTAYAAIAVQTDLKFTALGGIQGVIARWVDSSNYLIAYVAVSTTFTITVAKVVGGVTTALATLGGPVPILSTWYRLLLTVDAAGRYRSYFGQQTAPLTQYANGQDAGLLGTGGTLDDGKPGIIDINPTVTSVTRNYDNFAAWAPPTDAAIFASQSLEIRHDGVIREDSAGAIWAPVSDYEGDYLLLPPSRGEGRDLRVIAKASRSLPGVNPDTNIDDISAKLYVTKRGLHIPEA